MRPTARPLPTRAVLAVAVASAVTWASVAAAAPPKLGPNLAPNPSFELSQFETGPVAPGSLAQPLLPTGWTVEGATILFDHSPNAFHDGKRGAAISGALGGGRQICDGSSGTQRCTPNPAPSATSAVPARPFWKSQAPVPVTAGTKYRFGVWTIMPSFNPDAGVPGEGVSTRVRWTGANGAVLSTVDGPSLLKGPKRILGWKRISADLVAPKGATGAVLLLGHSDYTTTSTQVVFDEVSFGTVR